MTLSNDPVDPRADPCFRELAALFAKGFARLSKAREWREQMAERKPTDDGLASQKQTDNSRWKTSRDRVELTG